MEDLQVARLFPGVKRETGTKVSLDITPPPPTGPVREEQGPRRRHGVGRHHGRLQEPRRGREEPARDGHVQDPPRILRFSASPCAPLPPSPSSRYSSKFALSRFSSSFRFLRPISLLFCLVLS